MKINTKQQFGYSIIELLIYIALFAFLSIILVQSLITVMKTYAASSKYRALQNNGELVMERLTREIRNSHEVSAISACGATSGTLTLASTDADDTDHINTFSTAAGHIRLATDGSGASDISTNEVTVTALSFCSITTPVGKGVKSKLILMTPDATPTYASFYSTVLLRGQ